MKHEEQEVHKESSTDSDVTSVKLRCLNPLGTPFFPQPTSVSDMLVHQWPTGKGLRQPSTLLPSDEFRTSDMRSTHWPIGRNRRRNGLDKMAQMLTVTEIAKAYVYIKCACTCI